MILLFNGPPASGKDQAAGYFKAKGYKHLSFKHQLFKETFKYFGVSEDWFMEDYDNRIVKEQPSIHLGGLSRREALIYTSETVIKPKKGLDYFGKMVAEEIDTTKDYVISDGGFADELIPIINKIGSDSFVLVQIVREGCDYSKDSRRYIDGKIVHEYVLSHKTAIDPKYVLDHKFDDVRTHRIHNNSSINDLNTALEEIYEKECNVRAKERA